MEKQILFKRIFHPYWLWEDFKNGFYDNPEIKNKEENIRNVLEMFSSVELTEYWMNYVIDNWKYSCEHNLTNYSLNRIAWLGQSACCCFANIPSTVTMEAWSLLDSNTQSMADNIATITIQKWELKNKNLQLCLNFM